MPGLKVVTVGRRGGNEGISIMISITCWRHSVSQYNSHTKDLNTRVVFKAEARN